MDTPDKREQSQRADEHHLAQAFLEQAALLLAKQPEMTPELETQLARIAQQVGIPDAQQQIVVQLLLHQQASRQSNASPSETAPVADPPPVTAAQTKSQPTAPQPPPLPAPPAPAPPRVSPPAPVQTATSSIQTAATEPLSPAAPTGDTAAHIDAFLEQARQRVTQDAAVPLTRSDLEKLALETGLAAAAVHDLLESLTGVPLKSASTPRKSAGTPATDNPPPSLESTPPGIPAEQFLDRAREFCEGTDTLSRAVVRKLSRLGLKEYRLSSVYIDHLLQQVINEKGLQKSDQESSPHLPDDPRIRAFLASAAPILAEYRGINTQSRLLLSAVANDHKLEEDEVELAIGHLQSQPEERADVVTESQMRERVESFEKHLREVLQQQPHGIITPRILRKLQDAGVQGEGLSMALAKKTIHSVAQDTGVRTITQERAVEFIDRLLDDLLEHRSRINGTMRQQLHQEGQQWGLSGDQINAVISERLAANQVTRLRSARRTMTFFGFTFVLLLGICSALLYQILQLEPRATRPASDTEATDSADTSEAPVAAAATTDRTTAGDDWRDGPLNAAISQARGVDSAWREPLEQLSAGSETTRSAAYQRLVSLAIENVDAPTRTQLLGNVLAGCYAGDPSDTSAQQLRDTLLDTILDPETPLDPEDQAPFDLTIWTIETVATALSRPSLSDQRSTALAEATGERIGWLIDASLSPQELHRQCRAAVSRHFFHVLTAAAAFHPVKIHELREYAYQDARNWLDAAEIDRLDVAFLVEALRRVGDEWDVYRSAVERCVRSPDPAVVLKLLEMYQEIPNRSLVSYLTDLLLARAGKPAAGTRLTPADVSERVRVSLGTDAAATPEGRWRVLWSAAASAVDRLSPSSRDADWALLDDVLQLAHLNTMACALDQKERGTATFDQLHRAGAPPATRNLDNPSPRGKSPYVGLSGTTRSAIEITRQDRYIARALEVLSAPRLAQRQSALSQLVDLTRNADLTGGQATRLARYLTGKNKGQVEFDYMLAALPSFRHLPYLKLALADHIAAQQEVLPKLSQVVAKLLDLEEQSGGSLETWKRDLQQQLLRHALSGDDTETRDSGTGIHDSVQESLTESYATQARLRGLAEAQYVGATSPSEVLAALARHAAGILEPAVTGANRHFAMQINKQIDAAEYLSPNDFALTVRLQRLWLRLLCIDVVRRHAKLQSQADAIIEQLHQEDEKTTELVAQLRSGETALLRTWLLLAENTE
tara:strand:+ start:1564 stop:5262 length:3699 start_codon:yes stop_codon:yes gene_type:complete